MTAPSPHRAASAEERDRLRDDLLNEIAVWAYKGPTLAPLLDRITAAEARAKEAREEAADAVSQLDTWFNTKARADTDLGPAFKEALGGFLRTSRCGGMPTKLSDQIEAVLNRFIDLNAGLIVAPIIEAIVTERTTAATADRDRLATELAEARADAETVSSLAGKLEADRDRLADEVARLRSALKPFDALAGTWTVETAAMGDEILTLTNGKRMCGIKASAFIEARRALTVTGGTTDG
jgi:hypothetical protein